MSASGLTLRVGWLLAVPPLMWAGNALTGRLLAGTVPPLALNALRWSAALLILLPLGWAALATPARRAEVAARWRALAVLSALGVVSQDVAPVEAEAGDWGAVGGGRVWPMEVVVVHPGLQLIGTVL